MRNPRGVFQGRRGRKGSAHPRTPFPPPFPGSKWPTCLGPRAVPPVGGYYYYNPSIVQSHRTRPEGGNEGLQHARPLGEGQEICFTSHLRYPQGPPQVHSCVSMAKMRKTSFKIFQNDRFSSILKSCCRSSRIT